MLNLSRFNRYFFVVIRDLILVHVIAITTLELGAVCIVVDPHCLTLREALGLGGLLR